jgi:hypothetical protein
MSADAHRISLEDAVVMVRRAREAKLLPVNGWLIDGDIIREILAQPGATGLRAYLAATEAGAPTLVYVGTDQQGRDMYEGVLAEYIWPCPPTCDGDSPFNGGVGS